MTDFIMFRGIGDRKTDICSSQVAFATENIIALIIQVGVANTLIFSKLRDRLQQFNNLEMNEKRKADIQRMKRYLVVL